MKWERTSLNSGESLKISSKREVRLFYFASAFHNSIICNCFVDEAQERLERIQHGYLHAHGTGGDVWTPEEEEALRDIDEHIEVHCASHFHSFLIVGIQILNERIEYKTDCIARLQSDLDEKRRRDTMPAFMPHLESITLPEAQTLLRKYFEKCYFSMPFTCHAIRLMCVCVCVFTT